MAATRQHTINGQQTHRLRPVPRGPGRTTTPETFNSLMTGLEERVFGRLPDCDLDLPRPCQRHHARR